MFFNLSDIAIITVKSVNYRYNVHENSKYETIYLLENFVFEDCMYIYKNLYKYYESNPPPF